MRETIEFRIGEKDARRFLMPEDGIVMGPFGGDVRKLVMETNDIRYAKVGMLQREFRKRARTSSGTGTSAASTRRGNWRRPSCST